MIGIWANEEKKYMTCETRLKLLHIFKVDKGGLAYCLKGTRRHSLCKAAQKGFTN